MKRKFPNLQIDAFAAMKENNGLRNRKYSTCMTLLTQSMPDEEKRIHQYFD